MNIFKSKKAKFQEALDKGDDDAIEYYSEREWTLIIERRVRLGQSSRLHSLTM